MRRTALLFSFASLILALLAAAAPALELASPATALKPNFTVSEASPTGLRLTVEVPSLAVEEIAVEGVTYQALTLPDGGMAGEDGRAGLPTFTRLIALPAGMKARLVAVEPSERRLAGYRVFPVQPDGADRFTIDRDWYASGAASAPGAAIGESATMNALRVVPVTVQPVGFDPASGELRVADRLELTLEFTPDATALTLPRPAVIPESFDHLYRELVVNLEQSDLYRSGDIPVGPGTWLLIYPDVTGVFQRLQPLIDWRKRQGYNVITVSTTTTGTSNTAIKNYIQTTYNTVNPPLEFVTLAGDASGTYLVNCWNETLSGYNGEGDHYYTTLAGGDILADVHLGRLTFRTTDELDIIINKILGYETNPPLTDPGWFTRAGLCGDPSNSGIGVVYVNQWVKSQLLAQGYTQVDTIWGGNFPTLMTNSINQGLTGFGYRGWWGMSGMTSSGILSLSNGGELPFALVVTCGTGSFKSENTAISEAWTKASAGGGIGAVGTATLGTHTRYNNTYYKGAWDGAINGDHRLGVAHTRGKYELYSAYQIAEPNRVEIWSMWNNLMGEPATDMYTGIPAPLTVIHPLTLPPGASAVPVSVTSSGLPVAGARVTIFKNGEVRETRYTDAAGSVILPLSPSVTPGSLLVTVTGHNLFAYRGSVNLTDQTIFPALADHVVDDDAAGASLGNGDGRLSPGERIELPIALENLGSEAALGINASLKSDDPYVSVLTANQGFANIPAGGTVWSDGPFVFALAADAPEDHTVDLVVTVQSSLTSWVSLLQLVVASADLRYQSFTWSGGAGLDPGESGTLSLTLQNQGSAAASGVSATLISNSPWVTVTDPVGSFPDFALAGTGNNAGDPFALTVASSTFLGHLASFSLLLSYNERAVEEVEFQLTVGTSGLGQPTGPCNYGYYAFENTDTSHPQAPVYAWVEIAPNHSGPGTSAGLNDNGSAQDDTNVLTLPFTFRYFGEDFNQLSVCSNGWVAMGTTYLVAFRNYNIPCSGAPPNLIAPFWDDLYQSGSDKVYYWSDSANHRYVIQWSRLRNDYNGSQEDFELILYDPAFYPTATGDAEFRFQYEQVSNVDAENGYATVGMMNADRTDGLLISYWNQHPTSANNPIAGRAIRFLPLNDALAAEATALPVSMETVLWIGGSVDRTLQVLNTGDAGSLLYFALDGAALPAWLSVTGGTGSVPAGGSAGILLHFDATGLALGTYETTLAINTSGAEHLLVPVTLNVNSDGTASDAAPAVLALGQNHPNPFNPSTAIEFGLPTPAAVRITIFDVSGRAVTTLADGAFPAGWHSLNWDGRDAQGTPAAAGVYLYRLEVGAERIQRKMLLLK